MLSPEQFAELITLIQTTPEDHLKPEVRRAPRIEHACRITITLGDIEDSGPACTIELKDISARWMCFLHNEPMQPGTPFVVKLEAPGNENSVSILATAVHSRSLEQHSYQIGAEFTCVLGPQRHEVVPQTAEDLMRIRSAIIDC